MPAIPIKTLCLSSAGAIAAALLFVPAEEASAAKNEGCEGGGFVVRQLLNGGTRGQGESRIGAANLGPVLFIDGKYIEFYIVTSTFGIRDYAFTGAANASDITGGRRTPVWSEKTPDHRGSVLTSAVTIDNDGPDIVLERSGTNDLDMKIQAKDCAQGGVFQMEPERGDGTAHRLHPRARARGLLFRQSELPRARRRYRALQGHDRRGAVAGQHRQRLLAQVRRPRQRAGRRADRRAQLREFDPDALRHQRHRPPLRWGVEVGSGERRPHGLRQRRGCGRGGARRRPTAFRIARRRTRSADSPSCSASRSRCRPTSGSSRVSPDDRQARAAAAVGSRRSRLVNSLLAPVRYAEPQNDFWGPSRHGYTRHRANDRRRDPRRGARLRLAVDRVQRRRGLCRGRVDAHRRAHQDARRARGHHDPAADRPGTGQRFDRRSASAQRTGQGQARGGQGGDRGHDLGLQGPDRPRRPAGRANGRLRDRDAPGAERLVDDRIRSRARPTCSR